VRQCVAQQRGFGGERMRLDSSPDIFPYTPVLRSDKARRGVKSAKTMKKYSQALPLRLYGKEFSPALCLRL
jgi:hypothetical protein